MKSKEQTHHSWFKHVCEYFPALRVVCLRVCYVELHEFSKETEEKKKKKTPQLGH